VFVIGWGWNKSCVGINGGVYYVAAATVYNTPDDGGSLLPSSGVL